MDLEKCLFGPRNNYSDHVVYLKGTTLAAVLYLIYANDLVQVNDLTDIYCRANCTAMLFKWDNWNGARKWVEMGSCNMKM